MRRHKEAHLINRIGWLRASVLGANDGIVSTASLIVGVAAAQSAPATILLTGIAGLVAGAMSMAAGEYVSVSSQADSESADRAREENELATIPDKEREELIGIYELRGLNRALAEQVGPQAAVLCSAIVGLGLLLVLGVWWGRSERRAAKAS